MNFEYLGLLDIVINTMESGPRFRENSSEIETLLENPQEVFDSDIDKAREEARLVEEQLRRIGSIERAIDGTHVEIVEGERGKAPIIRIAWNSNPSEGTRMLELTPITEGSGAESGIFGYRGRYGNASSYSGDTYEFADEDEAVPLKELFGFPDAYEVIVEPTISRWAISSGQIPKVLGENVRILHMGLGQLLLGEEWMFIGNHEAGHLDDDPKKPMKDENAAWRKAKIFFAKENRPNRDAVVEGTSHGQFDILKRPSGDLLDVTIGLIERMGLVSHAENGNARIPKKWKDDADETLEQLSGTIESAGRAYDEIFG